MTDLKPPCILYDGPFKATDLERVKLTQNFQDETKKGDCPVFTGVHAIEALLHVEERFRKIARKMQWTSGDELFEKFSEVVADNAEISWDNIIDNIDPATINDTDAFDKALATFYLKYAAQDSRDTMKKYLESV